MADSKAENSTRWWTWFRRSLSGSPAAAPSQHQPPTTTFPRRRSINKSVSAVNSVPAETVPAVPPAQSIGSCSSPGASTLCVDVHCGQRHERIAAAMPVSLRRPASIIGDGRSKGSGQRAGGVRETISAAAATERISDGRKSDSRRRAGGGGQDTDAAAVAERERLERRLNEKLPLIWTFLQEEEGWGFVNSSSWYVSRPLRSGNVGELVDAVPQTKLPAYLVQHPELLERYTQWRLAKTRNWSDETFSEDSDEDHHGSETGADATSIPPRDATFRNNADWVEPQNSQHLVGSRRVSTNTSRTRRSMANAGRPAASISTRSANRTASSTTLCSADLSEQRSAGQLRVPGSTKFTLTCGDSAMDAGVVSAQTTCCETQVTIRSGTPDPVRVAIADTPAPTPMGTGDAATCNDAETVNGASSGRSRRVSDRGNGSEKRGTTAPAPRTRSRASKAGEAPDGGGIDSRGKRGERDVSGDRRTLETPVSRINGRVRTRVSTNDTAALSCGGAEASLGTRRKRGVDRNSAPSAPIAEGRRFGSPRTPAIGAHNDGGLNIRTSERMRVGPNRKKRAARGGDAHASSEDTARKRKAGGKSGVVCGSEGAFAGGAATRARGTRGSGGNSGRGKRKAPSNEKQAEVPYKKPRIKVEGEMSYSTPIIPNTVRAPQQQRQKNDTTHSSGRGDYESESDDPFAPYERIARETVTDEGLDELLHNAKRSGYLDLRRYRKPGFPRPLRIARIDADHGRRFYEHLQRLLKEGKRVDAIIFLKQLEHFDRIPPSIATTKAGVTSLPAWYQAVGNACDGEVEVDEVLDLTAEAVEVIDCDDASLLDCDRMDVVEKEAGLKDDSGSGGSKAGVCRPYHGIGALAKVKQEKYRSQEDGWVV